MNDILRHWRPLVGVSAIFVAFARFLWGFSLVLSYLQVSLAVPSSSYLFLAIRCELSPWPALVTSQLVLATVYLKRP